VGTRKSAVRGVTIAAVVFPLLGAADLPKAFEVASIKPCSADQRFAYQRLPGGGLYATGVNLKLLIIEAYGVKPFQIVGGPKWVDEDCWSLRATAAGVQRQLSIAEQAPMLRALLEERFQLKIRREVREGPVFALVLAKRGPKLTPHVGPSTEVEMRTVQGSWTLKNVAMDRFAERLARQLGRTVVDRTGLPGSYDLRLEWARDEGGMADADRVSIFTAIQEQLGLKLESSRGPVETLIIEGVEKPGAN
jgi:bla regulator protein blaR1